MDKLIKIFSKLLILSLYGAATLIAICTIILFSNYLIKLYSQCNTFLDYVKATGTSSLFVILFMALGFCVVLLLKILSQGLKENTN